MSLHSRQEIIISIQYLWEELDKTWDGDERPDNWDATCEKMAVLTESLGLEHDQHGDLK